MMRCSTHEVSDHIHGPRIMVTLKKNDSIERSNSSAEPMALQATTAILRYRLPRIKDDEDPGAQ